jgi:hypothetical protein
MDKISLYTKMVEEIREDFCGMCLAVPFALAGAGVAGLSSKEDYHRRKWIMISTGIIILIISMFLLWYYQDCTSCKA